ncbi:MAG TPA: phosphomannomutase/phosphoglucomutase [Candidatus Saccharimonadales bacterium]|nr:phosphomannomutase/phosphoglucomutase [Candidatus Saccharimonadales bacterium]
MAEAKLGDGIFKAYDIRGIYPKELDESTAEALGCSFGEYMGRGKTIGVCMDVRLSSGSLRKSFLKGVSSSDIKIVDLGVAPTPVIYFAVSHYGLDGGAIVTASHNPPEWNGFKFYGKGGEAIGMQNGLSVIRDTSRRNSRCESRELLVEDRSARAIDDYEKFLLGKISVQGKVRIGIDPGNGSYSAIAKRVFEKAGAEVLAINDSPDGSFAARKPEPNEETLGRLRELVVDKRLDFGIGFDPDGDRGVFVDGKGRVLRGDLALAVFVRNLLGKGEKVVFEVSSTDLIREEAMRKGGIPIMIRVGRTFFLRAMADEKAAMAGEMSGHTYFSEVYGGDDALFAGLKMAELVSRRGKPLSELVDELPHYESFSAELKVDEKLKYGIIDKIREKLSKTEKLVTIDGVKVIMDDGWFILRASNTTPIVRLVAEAKSRDALDRIVEMAKREFKEAETAAERK